MTVPRRDLASANFSELLALHATAQPTVPAFVLAAADGTERSLTFAELYARAGALADALAARVAIGDRVMLLAEPGLDYVAGFFGCLVAGVLPVPLYPPGAGRSAGRIAAVAATVEPRLCLVDRASASAVASTGVPPALVLDEVAAVPAAPVAIAAAGADTPAFLQFTSGSTRTPRGVIVTHGNLRHNCQRIIDRFEVTSESRLVSWLPPYHDMGLIGCILAPVFAGITTVLMAPSTFILHPGRWLRAISQHRATISGGPDFGYRHAVQRTTADERRALDLASWRVAFNGAEPIRAETLDAFARAFAECGFAASAFTPCYGLAESTLMATGTSPSTGPVRERFTVAGLAAGRGEPAGERDDAQTLVSSGAIDDGLVVVDPERGQAVPEGQVGEIWLRDASVALGYYRDPEATAATFGGTLRGAPERRYLRTGDLGFVHRGELYVTGRCKDLLIVRGRNLYPHDLEHTVEEAHPAIRAGAVAAFAIDGAQGEGVGLMCGIAKRPDGDAVIAAVLRALVAAHAVTPERVILVRAAEVPRTSSGKIQRQAARRLALEGGLEPLADWSAPRVTHEPTGFPAGARAIEDYLTALVAGQLGLAPDAIDRRAPFSNLGLDSVSLVKLAAVVEGRAGRRLPPTTLFSHPSIAALARHLATPVATAADASRSAGTARDVAIVGLAVRLPGAADAGVLLERLRSAASAIGPLPASRAELAPDFAAASGDHRGIAVGGFLEHVDRFDPTVFGIAAREAREMDPQQRLFLEIATEAIDDAGIVRERLSASRAGVFLGIASHDYLSLRIAAGDPLGPTAATGSAHSVAANRVSYELDLHGPSLAVDTACSSSLVAVHLAVQSLRAGESDVAIAGGVNVILDPQLSVIFAANGVLSPSGSCRPFDASADGFVRGEGAAAVVLKSLDRAVADGDRIYAVIRGSAVVQDGRSVGLMAPNGLGQEAVLRAALADAGADPGEVALIEAHGTGTQLGDAVELEALAAVLGVPGRRAPCAVGSIKSAIGHLEAAAGVAGLVKATLAIWQREALPTSPVAAPHASFAEHATVLAPAGQPRALPPGALAGVSSFGFGGTSAHVVLGAAPPRSTEAARDAGALPVIVSAHTPEALRDAARSLAEHLARRPELSLADVAYTSAVRRTRHRQVLALRARSRAELSSQLEQLARDTRPAGAFVGRSDDRRGGEVVLVFPGQGPRLRVEPDALAGLPGFAPAFAAFGAAVARVTGWSLADVLDATEHTEFAQPVIVGLQLGLAAVLEQLGVRVAAVIGHSLGEVAAACVAGALSIDDAARIAVMRGRACQAACGLGAMAAVSAPADRITAALARGAGRVTIGATNSASSVVLSGARDALAAVVDELARDGHFARMLDAVDYPSHSPVMEPFGRAHGDALRALRPSATTIPMVSTVRGAIVPGTSLDARYWVDNLLRPVRFHDGVAALLARGHDRFVEVGQPTLVRALLEHATPERAVHAIAALDREAAPVDAMVATSCALAADGADIDLAPWFGPGHLPCALPPFAWQRRSFWIAAGAPARRSAGILGRAVDFADDAGRERVVVAVELNGDDARVLAEHRIGGMPVVPAAAYLEIMLAAARDLVGTAVEVRAAAFERITVIGDAAPPALRVVAERIAGGASLVIQARESDGWHRVASATVIAAGAVLATGVPAPRGEAIATDELYRRLAARGLEYGDAFRVVEEVRVESPTTVRAELGGAAGAPLTLTRWLDGALHAVAALFPGDTELVLPRACGRIAASAAPLPARAIAHVAVRRGEAGAVVCDVTLAAPDGAPIVELHQLELARAGGGELARARATRLFGYRTRWEASAPLDRAGRSANAPFVLVGGDPSFARALVTRLPHGSVILDADRLRDGSRADHRRVIDSLVEGNARWAGIVDLRGTQEAAGLAGMRGAGSAFLWLAQALAQLGLPRPPRLFAVTRGGRPVAPDAVVDPAHAMIWGLARTIAFEHPELATTCIELTGDAEVDAGVDAEIDALAAELQAGEREDAIALAGDRRWVARVTPDALIGRAFAPRTDATYLVTGGYGALGWLVARGLAAAGARNLVLLGRREPTPEGLREIEALQASGVRVLVATGDVADREAVAELLAAARAHLPPLHGIVHAAGVLRDAALVDIDEGAVDAVWRPKVAGAQHLHELTLDDPLDFFVLFSSAAAMLGSPGQASYAAGCAYLDGLAAARRAAGRPALSIAWGPWAEVGLAARAEAAQRERGAASDAFVAMIAPDHGLRALTQLLGSGAAGVLAVLPYDLGDLLRFFPEAGAAPLFSTLAPAAPAREAAAQTGPARPPLSEPYVAPRTAIEGAIASMWRRALGVDPIGVCDSFFELGGDSVLAVQVITRVARKYDLRLDVREAFESRRFTVESIALRVEQLLLDRLAELDDAAVAQLLVAEGA